MGLEILEKYLECGSAIEGAFMGNLKKELGKKIRNLRKLKNLTQEKLGEKSGLSYKFVGEIERGEVNPSLDSLTAIANALNTKEKDLFPNDPDILLLFSSSELQLIKKTAHLLHTRLNPRRNS